MHPKKHKEFIQPVADELNLDKALVEDLIEFYWKEIRKNLVNCESHNIIIPNLGTFVAKPWKVPEVINVYQTIVNKYKSTIDSGNRVSFQKFALMKEKETRIEILKRLQNMILEDQIKKQNIKQKRDEQLY